MKFEKQKMVKWFSVPQLTSTGIKSLVSAIFGNYADKRETEAYLYSERLHDYSQKEEIWLDFISDLGDGFDSTYTMASLMAKENITIEGITNSIPLTLPRGNVLIMGGDQVYPTPSATEYKNRLQGPYNAAFPWKESDKERPHVFAIPGNHDWYDGLSSFLKLFCQDRALGNWLTQQKRSYFALKLPHNLWLWGIDIQLNGDIDFPQLQYFEKIASEQMVKGDRVILCTAEPAWVYEAITNNSVSSDRFEFFINRFFDKKGFQLITVLTGDLHHYSRYEESITETSSRQFITAGGGGAFMHSTHHLPEKIDGRRKMHLKSTFPNKSNSQNLLFQNLLFPFQNFSMSFLLGALHLFSLWLLQSKTYQTAFHHSSFLETIAWTNFFEFSNHLFGNLAHNPAVVILNLIVFGGILAFTDTAGGKYKRNYFAGILHGLLHLLMLYFLIWAFSIFNLQVLGLSIPSGWTTLLYCLEMLLIGSIVSGFIFGLYLITCNLFLSSQGSEAYSALRHTGFKNFLRIHISSEAIILYPIGVRNIVENWKNVGTMEDPKFVGDEIKYELIEQPIVIK